MPRCLVFDVNETLLDVHALAPSFVDVFGDGNALREWFSTLLLYSEVATLAGPHEPFSSIAGAALDMTADRRGIALSSESRGRVLAGMLTLPAHADVAEGLRRLRDAGFRLGALSNSSQAAVEAPLAHAGLSSFFERLLSVESVRRFKPSPEPYLFAAQQFGVEVIGLPMVPRTRGTSSGRCARAAPPLSSRGLAPSGTLWRLGPM